MMKLLSLFIFLMLLSGCLKQSESIDPIAESKPLSDLQKEMVLNYATNFGTEALSTSPLSIMADQNEEGIFYLNISYKLKNIDVFETANVPNAFEQIGHSFLLSVTRLVLSSTGPQNVDIPAIDFTVPSLDIDRTVVRSVKIKKIFLQYTNELETTNDFLTDFSYIDSLELTRPIPTKYGTFDSLMLSYRKTRNQCLLKCIQFDIFTDNVLDFVSSNSHLSLKPSLSIASIPEVTDLKIDGVIELQIGIKLPF